MKPSMSSVSAELASLAIKHKVAGLRVMGRCQIAWFHEFSSTCLPAPVADICTPVAVPVVLERAGDGATSPVKDKRVRRRDGRRLTLQAAATPAAPSSPTPAPVPARSIASLPPDAVLVPREIIP